MSFSWETLVGILVPAAGGAFWAYHNFDKRLDRLESDLRLLTYRLDALEIETARRGGRLKQAIYEITQWLQKRGFVARSQGDDGPWPTADPPTSGVYLPKHGDEIS